MTEKTPAEGEQNLLNKAKEVADGLKDKVGGFVGKHEDQIDSAIDKTKDFVDDKTKGKYSDKIDKASSKAKDAVGKISSTDDGSDSDSDEPPAEQQ